MNCYCCQRQLTLTEQEDNRCHWFGSSECPSYALCDECDDNDEDQIYFVNDNVNECRPCYDSYAEERQRRREKEAEEREKRQIQNELKNLKQIREQNYYMKLYSQT